MSISVVIPALNEAGNIGRLVEETYAAIPPERLVEVIVVDDHSPDATSDVVRDVAKTDSRVHLIRHDVNGGVGKAISTGYIWCRDNDIDIAVVMAGDA
ncbi:MAG: glycosyltransferase family 2 protein, partial [Alphaproteobacteria bacterium]